jgi:hypothetical protein
VRRGQTLVATLIVIVIMLALAVVLFRGSGAFSSPGESQSSRPDGMGQTVLGDVRLRAIDTQCQNNLRQVRGSVEVYNSMNEDMFPESLQATRLPADFLQCPLGKVAYLYEPAQGYVSCPHPGHEKY